MSKKLVVEIKFSDKVNDFELGIMEKMLSGNFLDNVKKQFLRVDKDCVVTIYGVS